jgi:hypothetical protein
MGQAVVLEEGLSTLDRRTPRDHVGLEGGSVAILVRMLQFVEGCVFGVEERSVTAEEVVVDVPVENRAISSACPMVRFGHGTSYARAGP